MTETPQPVRSLEIQGKDAPDAFIGNQAMQNIFVEVADHLSLWCQLYGLRERDIVVTGPEWQTPNIMFIRIRTRDGRPVSMSRYDPRLPETPHVFRARAIRIKAFVSSSPWFRRKAHQVDEGIRVFMDERKMKLADLDVVSRWTSNGCVLFKMLDKRRGLMPADMMTHLKHE